MTHDPRAEAAALTGLSRDDVRVLEPSPPAINAEPWFADDPVEPGGRLTPLGGGWDSWTAAHPEQRSWVAERWLTARSLASLPPQETLSETRVALHRLAVYVVSPARRRANGKLALRWTLGGLGTPFFGDDEQIRIAGDQLIRSRPEGSTAVPVTSLNDAAEFALDGPPDLEWAANFDVPDSGECDAPLVIDAVAAGWIGDWFGLGTRVLEELRAGQDTRVQLWPEHFDLALSLPVHGATATCGVSPGDGGHEEPYLYVLPGREVAGGVWNATGFTGAVLGASALLGTPVETALAFFTGCIEALT